MPFADSDGARIFWDSNGVGDAVLLIMGHAGPRQMWHWVVPALAEHHRVISFDNRGIGQSEWRSGPYTVELMAADAVAVLDAAGVAKAAVYGAS
ncbi:MAG TPA: alpha/beta fold hydrolase, partial [Acidimicrobiales bacterium]|nr:alpha/beta fold hydrolase [Acidimicrobiales bacterium]